MQRAATCRALSGAARGDMQWWRATRVYAAVTCRATFAVTTARIDVTQLRAVIARIAPGVVICAAAICRAGFATYFDCLFILPATLTRRHRASFTTARRLLRRLYAYATTRHQRYVR